MTKVMLWPDVYREQGHWLPAINLAKSLKDAGYVVEFMGIPDTQRVVSPYQVTFHTILEDVYRPGHSLENDMEPKGQRWKPEHLLPLARGALDNLFTGAGKPDVLVVGYFACLEALILRHKYGVPIVTLTTYLRHPHDDPARFAKARLLGMPDAVAKKIMTLASSDDTMDIERFIQHLKEQPEMIPMPQSFDFADPDWKHDSTVHYVEPMIQRAPLDESTLPDNSATYTHPIPSNKKIIFATSGSQVADYEDKARQLFLNLIGMMKTPGLEDYHLVLATGEKLLRELEVKYGIDLDSTNHRLPTNITIAAWVSQLEIVKQAEVVFMHGGLATIKESLFEGVPIVIVPLGKDQQENALRIRRGQLGLAPRSGVLSPQILRKYLTQVKSSPVIATRVANMKQQLLALENASPKPSVSLIDNVLNPPVP